jgi:hypothetical protein
VQQVMQMPPGTPQLQPLLVAQNDPDGQSADVVQVWAPAHGMLGPQPLLPSAVW